MLDHTKVALPPGNHHQLDGTFEKSLLDIGNTAALDEIDSILSSAASTMEESSLVPFASLLNDPQLTLTGDMPLDDSTSEVSSDTDSGFQESPPAWADDSLDAWLTKSVASSQMGQALPSIDSIMSNPQLPSKVMTTTEQSFTLDNSIEFQQNATAAADLMLLTPPTTPCISSPIETSVQIKTEPLDSTTCLDMNNLHAAAASPLTVQNVLAATSAAAQQNQGVNELLQQQIPGVNSVMQQSQGMGELMQRSPVKTEAASAEELFRLKFSPHVLPPCRVCGAQATGYHYGANTCEPCKGFYHRMTKRMDKNLACLKQNNCVITAKNRGACPACRYQKCIKAGMCKNNIKTGRYSYSKRSRDIIELQNSISERKQQQQRDAYELALQAHSALAQTAAAAPTRQVVQQETLPVETDVTSQCIITALKAAREKIMGKMMQTGCDLSAEQQTAIHVFSQHLENGQRSLAYESFLQWVNLSFKHNHWSSFVKAIPGFKTLPMQDQIAIIKKCFMDFWAVTRHRLFDVSSGMFYTFGGITIPINDIIGDEPCSDLMKAVKRLQSLSLSSDECCTLSAFVAVNAESTGMTDIAGVEQIKQNLLDALMYALRQNRARPELTFAQIISALTQLKSAVHAFPRQMTKFHETVTPPLFHEIVLANLDS